MQYKFILDKTDYDGTQLKSLFAYMNHGVLGDSIVAFIGACDISFDHMVDGEDVLAGAEIRGASMLHFIIEEFGISLELAVTRQRLFAAMIFEELVKQNKANQNELFREGDDIYFADKKLSISIATVSPVSSLIHFALNINNENTPVKTISLNDLGIEPKLFSDLLGVRFISEIKSIKEACCKVRWVK